MASRLSCDFPDRVFLKHKSKVTGECCVMWTRLRSLPFSERMTKDGGVEYYILFPLNEKEILKEVV